MPRTIFSGSNSLRARPGSYSQRRSTMRRGSLIIATKFCFMILFAQGVAAQAAEVKVLSALAMRPVMNELGPQFERATGHKLAIQFEVIGVLRRQIDAGER